MLFKTLYGRSGKSSVFRHPGRQSQCLPNVNHFGMPVALSREGKKSHLYKCFDWGTRMMKSAKVLIAVLLLATGVTAAWGIRGTAVGDPTRVDLQAAFAAASNAHTRYLAFAQKADQEGYGEVASLFRAAARSEQIQAGNYAGLLKKMGASTDAKPTELVLGPTSDNLELSVKAEAHDRDRLYTQFIQRAQAHRDLAAVKLFDYAAKAANEHHRLFAEAYRNLEKLSGTTRKTFYVCAECGLTSSTLNFESCPCCFNASEKFVEVN